ncbi:MAG: hypothetical protein IT531_06785 [Burkholderiales bacterium]|nr:hypothetical protein [Burkholderiales bacterium]
MKQALIGSQQKSVDSIMACRSLIDKRYPNHLRLTAGLAHAMISGLSPKEETQVMPLSIGDDSSSRSLLVWEKYKDKQLKVDRDTRIDQAAMEWLIAVSNGVTYCIKFSGNFHKKHFYTSTKKPENVQAEYDKLDAIKDDTARWLAAQEAADEVKFRKQLAHRTRKEQDCGTCGHPAGDHPASGACAKVTQSIGPTGKMKNGKPERGPIFTPCTCVKYAPPYAEKRGGMQGKPSVNPLVGATTAGANDVIWMDKIPRAHFEKVIVAAIQKRMSELKNTGKSWGEGDVSGDKAEHVEWDFGANHRGCILKIDQKTSLADAKAKNYSSVEVLMKLDDTDAKKPVFTACHLDGKKTK